MFILNKKLKKYLNLSNFNIFIINTKPNVRIKQSP